LGIESLSRGRRGPRAFETSLAIAVITSLVALTTVIYVSRWLGVMTWRWWKARQGERTNRSPAFYRRLERLLTHLPVVRKEGETPRELARGAALKLERGGSSLAAAALPGELVTTYYRVRFGNDRLDKAETDAIEQALIEIDAAVKQSSRG
jgi:hypothetical protein